MNIISKHDLKKWLDVSDGTIWRWTNYGWLVPIKHPEIRKVYYDKDQVENFLTNKSVNKWLKNY